ncbi:3-hydroxyacyl-ACP dehydratase FabZ [Candidatus Cytomitobacter primus]|uniref:3-hydroxyacyl-[acyl-carrier-protein] dehydratase FabZ n=1 Tax=Candidatus Cytomitobacter primus TaxID=2066024 RepID=A0A5C0UGB7_9PROT|nr:3-hydroxyacyl-ACP dehydratase FabZ [Candidatus Cytomitobacter primus]QEK38767.1 3-hydroxyacyl-ACP dehydratase FabZ [Candidatus Cytomitobacter primus]
MLFNTAQIQNLIPHRFPFLFLDKIEEVKVWEFAIGHKCFTINEHFFAGHFPDHPVVPGVILIEAMAQLATLCVAYSYKHDEEEIPSGVAFMSIEKAKFRKSVEPGDNVKFIVKQKSKRRSIFQFSGSGFVNDVLVCESDFMAMSR